MYYQSLSEEKPVYKPALERWNQYKSIWIKHWPEFEKLYSPLDEEKVEEVKKLVQCCEFKNGFQRHLCPDCGLTLIVPFTCKSRLCLSCARKRLFGWSFNLSCIMNTNLKHNHVTFTIPGTVSHILFERKYQPEQMITLAANVFRNMFISSAKLKGKEFQPGILATLHKSGNGLNSNPHVHLIGTREIIDTKTGEIIENVYIPYKKIRHVWAGFIATSCRSAGRFASCFLKEAFLNHLVKQNILTAEESAALNNKFQNGFHVFFQPIEGDANEVLFRTAEYIATGYFHDSQITAVDHVKKTVTFKYKSWVDRGTREKSFKTRTMDLYCFMGRMLFFLPEKNRKMIRYYGIYAHKLDEKIRKIETRTWAKAIENSFQKNPEVCPDCLKYPPIIL